MEHFRANGYTTYGAGKIFHQGHDETKDDESGFGLMELWDHRSDMFTAFGPWPGRRIDGTWNINQAHPSMPTDYRAMFISAGPYDDITDTTKYPNTTLDGWRLAGRMFDPATDKLPDEEIADWTVDQLNQWASAENPPPFFMVAGFIRPHNPHYARQEFFDLFPLETVEPLPFWEEDLSNIPEVLWRELVSGQLLPTGRNFLRLVEAAEAEGRTALEMRKRFAQAYLACVAAVDQSIGEVLDAVTDNGLLDNTIIILTSDHGYHLGEKYVIGKTTVWEESCRVPFIIHAPGVAVPGSVSQHPVSLVDLYPTLIDLCDLPTNPNAETDAPELDGFSLRPLLGNPTGGAWDGSPVAFTGVPGPYYRGLADDGIPMPAYEQQLTVRSERYRYTRACTGEEELYDLVDDPDAWFNLADDPDYFDLRETMRQQLIEVAGLPPLLYVDAAATTGGDGSSWDAAFTSINAALAVAVPGSTICVAEGVYAEAISLGSSIVLEGGYAPGGGTRDPEQYRTIIDVSDLPRPVRPLTMARRSTADGLVLTGGQGHEQGGGVLMAADTRLARCRVQGNQSTIAGAGVYASGRGGRIVRCAISDNHAEGPDFAGGAAMAVDEGNGFSILSSVVHGNVGPLGAALWIHRSSDTRMVDCTIDGNIAGRGATIRLSDNSSLECMNTLFSHNEAPQGRLIVCQNDSSARVIHGLFDSNTVNHPLQDDVERIETQEDARAAYRDRTAGDFRLTSGSDAIDAGTVPPFYFPRVDFAGAIRGINGSGDGLAARDIGAFEYSDDAAPGGFLFRLRSRGNNP